MNSSVTSFSVELAYSRITEMGFEVQGMGYLHDVWRIMHMPVIA